MWPGARGSADSDAVTRSSDGIGHGGDGDLRRWFEGENRGIEGEAHLGAQGRLGEGREQQRASGSVMVCGGSRRRLTMATRTGVAPLDPVASLKETRSRRLLDVLLGRGVDEERGEEAVQGNDGGGSELWGGEGREEAVKEKLGFIRALGWISSIGGSRGMAGTWPGRHGWPPRPPVNRRWEEDGWAGPPQPYGPKRPSV